MSGPDLPEPDLSEPDLSQADLSEAALWRLSGAEALTGRGDGPPLRGPGRPASAVRRALDRIAALHPEADLPGVEVLGERASYGGLVRNGPWSCGGAFRVLPTRDGALGISLARESDLALVPALVEASTDDPWTAVADWARRTSTAEAATRVALLGLAGGAVPEPVTPRPAVVSTTLGRRSVTEAPLVVDLTSLWAGPLCARLLGLTGARVVKVESTTRPDGARLGPAGFFDLLHHGHEQLSLDFATQGDALRELVGAADLVLEASRPRALLRLGLVAEDVAARGTSWLSITARGRGSDTVGFGDDVAACAGHVIVDGDDLLPVGDALADPLAGVTAAATAVEALATTEARLIDLSMLHVAREAMS